MKLLAAADLLEGRVGACGRDTFVLKPSELTPSTAMLLMRTLSEADLPDGVANLVPGAGAEVGAPLTEHPDVDLVYGLAGGYPWLISVLFGTRRSCVRWEERRWFNRRRVNRG